MTNDLAGPTDLAHLPGAPFTDAEVDGAVGALRDALGWHVAPERAETGVPFDVMPMEDTLRLVTRKLVSVQAVRRVSTSDPAGTPITNYRISRRQGIVRRTGMYWPCGLEAVEVDFTHGYAQCPPALLPVIAQLAVAGRRDKSIRQVSIDDGSTTFGSGAAEFIIGPDLMAAYAYPKWAGAA